MLVFSRDRGERFIIGDDITITILGIEENKVKIGIEAPKQVAVHREEIYQRIQNQKKAVDIA